MLIDPVGTNDPGLGIGEAVATGEVVGGRGNELATSDEDALGVAAGPDEPVDGTAAPEQAATARLAIKTQTIERKRRE